MGATLGDAIELNSQWTHKDTHAHAVAAAYMQPIPSEK